jgi:PAS domain S-box-containing protein/putative nucleotidyltransferase with HDIG domain
MKSKDIAIFSMILAGAYWIAEAVLHSTVFHHGSFGQNLFPDGSHEIWTRTFTLSLFIGFGFIAQSLNDRRADIVAKRGQAQFKRLMDESPEAMGVHQQGKPVYANAAALKLLGAHSFEEIAGRDILTFVHPTDREEADKRIHRIIGKGECSYRVEEKLLRPNGESFLAEVTAIPVEFDGRQAVMVVARDIEEHKRSELQLAAYVSMLEETMRGTLQAVSNMVEQRDPYTAGHERRVGIIAADIAREMGWPEEKCRELQLIGLVHDIGKIGIPAEILSKPSRLSAMEYELVKSHVERGYEILKDVKFSLPIANIIRQHHERMDGSGYPQGLKDEDILPEARILAVADVMESMASHRPYRPALGIEKALDEIGGNRGTKFDAEVVDALLRLVHERGYQVPD